MGLAFAQKLDKGARPPLFKAERRRIRRRYLSGSAATLLVILGRFLAGRYWGSSPPLITLYPAVLLAAWLGGLGPGLLACAVCTVAGAYLDLLPMYSFSSHHYGDFAALVLFFLIGAMMVFIIDAHAKAEARVRGAAESADKMKDTLLAMVTHDLRAPLHAILGAARALGAFQLPQEAVPFIAMIERNAHAQAHLWKDLMDVSQISAGRLALNLQPESIRSIVEFTLDSMQPQFAGKNLHVEYTTNGLERNVLADADRVQQIVMNLLCNAVKFTKPGGSIFVDIDEWNESQTKITIRDSGMGIPPGFLPDIFSAFSQGQIGKSRDGLGLGLAIVKHLVDLHGGTIEARSDGPGTGSAFVVRFLVHGSESASPLRSHLKHGREARSCGGLRV